MSEYRLYCFGESGNCYKVALMLRLSAAATGSRYSSTTSAARRAAMPTATSMNELGEAPVLEHEGQRLAQSGAILTWLAARTGQFGGRDEHEQLEALRWILFDNHKFTAVITRPCVS